MIFIAILGHHTTLTYYTYKSKLYFIQNKMMIFCSLVKITTATTQIYKETNKKEFFLGQEKVDN